MPQGKVGKRLGYRGCSTLRFLDLYVIRAGNTAPAPVGALVKFIADCPFTGSIWPAQSILRDCADPCGMIALVHGRLSELAGDFDPTPT